MGKKLTLVEQFNKQDYASNCATIELLNRLSYNQQESLIDMVNKENKKAFDLMRKRGKIK